MTVADGLRSRGSFDDWHRGAHDEDAAVKSTHKSCKRKGAREGSYTASLD